MRLKRYGECLFRVFRFTIGNIQRESTFSFQELIDPCHLLLWIVDKLIKHLRESKHQLFRGIAENMNIYLQITLSYRKFMFIKKKNIERLSIASRQQINNLTIFFDPLNWQQQKHYTYSSLGNASESCIKVYQ